MKLESAIGLENAAWPVFVVDPAGVIRRANPAASSLLGSALDGEPRLAETIWAPENPLPVDQFLRQAERSQTPSQPVKLRVKGGNTVTFDAHICTSVREGQRSFLFQLLRPTPPPPAPAASTPSSTPKSEPGEASLDSLSPEAQKQRLECAIQLARTVSLDFNNALTTILGHTSLILSRTEPGHPWRHSLLEVEKSAQRAAEITQDLAAFSRPEKDVATHAAGNLNRVIRRAVEVFQKPGSPDILWNLQLEKRLFSATFDEAKMQQAVIKLLENAVDAVAGRSGRITVRTTNHTLEEAVRSHVVDLAAGNYVCIEIIDNGVGIPADVLPRVFEPFFTTKQTPQHRGLGLAWVYGIITNHGGTVAITSQPSQGAAVRVFLPALQQFVIDQATRIDDLRGNQTVLIVDDEEMLLTLGQTILTNFGYKVLTANSGERAIELFSQSPNAIDLVITDLVMPGMGGRELVDYLRRLAPHVAIICTSGYVRAAAEGPPEEGYLRKPYTSNELLRKVKAALTPGLA